MGLQEIDVAQATPEEIRDAMGDRFWKHKLTLNGVKYQNMLPEEIDDLVMTLAQMATKPPTPPAQDKKPSKKAGKKG